MTTLAALERWFADANRVLLGYSGGIDSALLAVVGTRVLKDDFLAVIGRSASLAADQAAAAESVAARFGIGVLSLETTELDDPSYRSNAPDRCYFCKRELWSRLTAVAAARDIPVVIDGTHLDDRGDHRPGAAAGLEHGVRSPYLELGWTKAVVRAVARDLGLATWDAPAAPCLASRIRYGLEVTADRLRQVEAAESLLRSLGVRGDLRVRHHGAAASVEVVPEMEPLLDARWPEIEARIGSLGFATVQRDPRGYRRGSLLPVVS